MCENSTETWRSIPGYEGHYEVSDRGRIRSFKYGSPRILKLNRLPKKGYRFVILCKNAKKRNFYIHQLVLLAFVGPCPPGMECRHFPDNSVENNFLNNLSWGTSQQNQEDRKYHGTTGKGRRNKICGEKVWWKAKLAAEKVNNVRAAWATGNYRVCELARLFEIDQGTARDIVTGRTWKHLLVGSEVKIALEK